MKISWLAFVVCIVTGLTSCEVLPSKSHNSTENEIVYNKKNAEKLPAAVPKDISGNIGICYCYAISL